MTAPLPLLAALQAAAAEGLAPNLERFLRFLGWQEGEWLELQALGVPDGPRWKNNKAARASTLAELTRLAVQGDTAKGMGVYAIFNRIKPAVTARHAQNAWFVMGKGESTADQDIAQRRLLYIDLDPERQDGVKGISATDAELEAASQRAFQAHGLLLRHLPAASIGAGLSGNGCALFVALEACAPEGEVERLVKAALVALDLLLSDPAVKVDVSVSDPKRLCFLPGTVKRKGTDSAERPHRRSSFLAPEETRRLTLDELRDFVVLGLRQELPEEQRGLVDAALADPKTKAKVAPKAASAASGSVSGSAGQGGGAAGGEDAFRIANQACPVVDVLARLALLDGDQPICPGCREQDNGVAIVRNGLKCSHNRCAGKGFREGFRSVVDVVMEVHGGGPKEALDWLRAEFPAAGIPEPKSKGQKTTTAKKGQAAGGNAPPPAAPPVDDSDGKEPDGRPVIRISTDLEGNVSAGIGALASREGIYTRALTLSQVVEVTDVHGVVRSVIRQLPRATLQEALCSSARWERYNPMANKGQGAWTAVMPSEAIVKAVEARGRWQGIRPLVGVTRSPFLRRDGTVCDVSGYDPSSGYLVDCRVDVPKVADAPTQADARKALATLLDLFCDFPFVPGDKASRYVPIAAILTLLVVPGLDGANVPAFLVDANTPGVGKSLMIDVVCLIATGFPAPRQDWGKPEEMAKVLGAAVLEGADLVAFDNISKIAFGGAMLDMLLTCAGRCKPRVLGKSEAPEMLWRGTILGTGNNIIVEGDTRRRTLLCRQQTELENPEDREGFKYPELKAYVKEHRGELLAAALTILRAHAVAGRPACGVRRLGSFEEWSTTVASAIAWAGGANVLDAMPRAETSDDPRLSAIRVLLEAWDTMGAGYPMRIGVVAEKLYPQRRSDDAESDDGWAHVREALELLAPVRGGGHVRFNTQKLGYVLREHRGRNLGGRAFQEGPIHHGSKTWQVVKLSPPGGGNDGDMGEVSNTSPIAPPAEKGSDGGSEGHGGTNASPTQDTCVPVHAPVPTHTHASAHTHDARAQADAPAQSLSSDSSSAKQGSPTSPTSPMEGKNTGDGDGGSEMALPPFPHAGPQSAWERVYLEALASGRSDVEARQIADFETGEDVPDV